jgi:hypothetical protein
MTYWICEISGKELVYDQETKMDTCEACTLPQKKMTKPFAEDHDPFYADYEECVKAKEEATSEEIQCKEKLRGA